MNQTVSFIFVSQSHVMHIHKVRHTVSYNTLRVPICVRIHAFVELLTQTH